MTTSEALHECRNPLCGNYAVDGGWCHEHWRPDIAPASQSKRIATPRGLNLRPSNPRFRWMRRAYLMRHPLCAVCHEPATDLDHITPHRGDAALYWAQSNWQALCHVCHSRKTKRETLDGATGGGRLVVLMGAPGSGKSTYAARFREVVTTDTLRAAPHLVHDVFEDCFARIEALLAAGGEVVFDTTSANPSIRQQALAVARRRNARCELVVFDTGADDCVAAQAGRPHPVDESTVRRVHADIRAQMCTLTRSGFDCINIVTRASD